MAISEAMPGDEIVETVRNETLTCKVLKVVGSGTHGTFTVKIGEPRTAFCCDAFRKQVQLGVFGGNDSCRDGSWLVLSGNTKRRMNFCPFCGAILKGSMYAAMEYKE